MKKRFLPKYWMHQWVFGEYEGQNAGFVEVLVRFGNWMSSDMLGTIREDIYIVPSIIIQFNHSELMVKFVWLTFMCSFWYKNWKREEEYRKKLCGE